MKDWVKGCDMGFYVGQKVYGIFGEGVIVRIHNDITYPLYVDYISGEKASYTMDGCVNHAATIPSLYPIELTPKFYQPEWQPKDGEWCWFWNNDFNLRKHYAIRRALETPIKGKFLDDSGEYWSYCAPFDKDNMTPPWERGEQK